MSRLSDLVLSDDLHVENDPDNYQDQNNQPAPPAPGNYQFRVLKHGPKVSAKTMQPILADGQYPVLRIDQVNIVAPEQRTIFVNTDVRTKPFERMGTLVSQLADVTRSFDQDEEWHGLKEGLDVLDAHIEQGHTFTGRLGWRAYDSDYVKSARERIAAEGRDWDNLPPAEKNQIYNTATIRRVADFRQRNSNGEVIMVPTVTGPSGATLRAYPEIVQFYPSNDPPDNLGPFEVPQD